MKRPENIIDPKDYDKPQSFERDWDAEIYYSYIEAQKYIDYLESEVKKFRLGGVVGRSEQLNAFGKWLIEEKYCLDNHMDDLVEEFLSL